MKAITASLIINASVLTIHFALGASTPDRPPGIEGRDWIPVSIIQNPLKGPGCSG
jgi:hypothetical protein